MTEDAFITFRVIDNFLNGYGLTWNVTERVQVYTHPLWLFLLAIPAFFTHELIKTTILTSTVVAASALLLLMFRIVKGTRQGIVCALLLIGSKSFVEFSTSGMENPLIHLWLAVFFWVYSSSQEISLLKFGRLSFIAGLGVLTRMDTFLFFLLPLGYAFWQLPSPKKRRGVLYAALGFFPFVLWELFSLFYYGFLFPNTAYAKLNIDIPRIDMIRQGILYFIDCAKDDPLAIAVIAAGIILPWRERDRKNILFSLGILGYALYLLWIGGDYMTGRFISVPFWASVLLIARSNLKCGWKTWGVVLPVFLALSYSSLYPNLFSGADYGYDNQKSVWPDRKISLVDERKVYSRYTNLFGPKTMDHDWKKEGMDARLKGEPVVERKSVGNFGYHAGPKVHILDSLALGDALLARIPKLHPAMTSRRFLIEEPRYGFVPFFTGHYERVIPDGYRETLISGENKIENQALAAYYDKLARVIRGDLWNVRRLKEIWRFNTGRYDALMRDYLKNPKLRFSSFLLSEMGEGEEIFGIAGVEVDIERECHASRVDIQLGNKHDYVAAFTDSRVKNGKIFTSNIRARTVQDRGVIGESVLTSYQVPVPLRIVLAGFDRIYIVPRPDDDKIPRVDKGRYKIGSVRLME